MGLSLPWASTRNDGHALPTTIHCAQLRLTTDASERWSSGGAHGVMRRVLRKLCEMVCSD
jgi:hypothetical protein